MPRDHRNLKVFSMSDELAVGIYKATKHFPREEMFGLTSQIRRAAVSIPANIVEGSARDSLKDYQHFMVISFGSLMEVGYLLDLSRKLGYLGETEHKTLNEQHANLSRALNALISSLKKVSPKANLPRA